MCSTGIACYVHEPGVASTVHSWYGLQTADLPGGKYLIEQLENSLVVERVKSADVVIWDEASMCSRRTLELVNAFHHRLANNDLSRQHPFAGKQFILVGEFLQLRPVPDVFDDVGFIHPIFESVFPHRFELTQVMRQSDEKFVSAICDLRMGICSKETQEFIVSLERELRPKSKKMLFIFFS